VLYYVTQCKDDLTSAKLIKVSGYTELTDCWKYIDLQGKMCVFIFAWLLNLCNLRVFSSLQVCLYYFNSKIENC